VDRDDPAIGSCVRSGIVPSSGVDRDRLACIGPVVQEGDGNDRRTDSFQIGDSGDAVASGICNGLQGPGVRIFGGSRVFDAFVVCILTICTAQADPNGGGRSNSPPRGDVTKGTLRSWRAGTLGD